jgi:hypothetical protein
VKEHEAEVEVPVVVVVVVIVEPVRAALTFAIVELFAPKEERSERIDWTCALVRLDAYAIGASESIDVAIASPVATAATFATALRVTVLYILLIF